MGERTSNGFEVRDLCLTCSRCKTHTDKPVAHWLEAGRKGRTFTLNENCEKCGYPITMTIKVMVS